MEFKPPRYTLEIDEEGFPSFDGLRIDDEDYIAKLFAQFSRLDPANPNSALLATCDGEICLVVSFESPLVAQSVEKVGAEASVWVFPGKLRIEIPHSAIAVDDWQRIRALAGPLGIPATLSRKAQADFGQRLLESGSKMDVHAMAPWYLPDPQKKLDRAEFWQAVYREKRDGWEMGEPTPLLAAHGEPLLKHLAAQPPVRCLVPGAGRGHDAEAIARRLRSQNPDGASRVEAIDFAPDAEAAFGERYSQSTVEFIREDVFDFLKARPDTYDAIFEHTFLCAIDPVRRQNYFDLVACALKDGGVYFGVFWMRGGRTGPPYGLTGWELREHARVAGLEFVEWQRSTHSWAPRWGQEFWTVLRKRA